MKASFSHEIRPLPLAQREPQVPSTHTRMLGLRNAARRKDRTAEWASLYPAAVRFRFFATQPFFTRNTMTSS
jgi:hypothetical protein